MPLYELDGKRPDCHPTAWVAPSADLIAEVVLAEGASVWFGAVIRADNTAIRVGARSNVQEGAMLHSDPGTPLIIGEDCTVGHHAILHGCTIGKPGADRHGRDRAQPGDRPRRLHRRRWSADHRG